MARLKVIFWDIDGTLIRAGGAGELAWIRALEDLYGIQVENHGISWSGQTDPHVSNRFAEKYDLPESAGEAERFFDRYAALLPAALEETQGEVLPGIPQLLEYIDQHQQIEQGLLTGNIRRGAELKLAHYGLNHYFTLGGFADGLHLRPAIAERALRLARETWDSQLASSEVLVIGDTPFDVECGRAIGARTLGVGTGFAPWESLEAAGPDFLYPDLSDVQQVLGDLDL